MIYRVSRGPSDPLIPNIAWWKMDDASGTLAAVDSLGLRDLSKSGTHLDGGAIGHIDGAWTFDGENNDSWLSNNTPFTSSEVALACWINLNMASDYYTVHAFDTDLFDKFIAQIAPETMSIFNFFLSAQRGVGSNPANGFSICLDTIGLLNYKNVIIPSDEWHHVGFEVSSSGVNIYLDGTQLLLTNAGGLHYPGSDVVTIGNDQGSSNRPAFMGLLDDIRVWDHTLSSTDWAALAAM